MLRTLQVLINTWPKEPRESAKRLIKYYGEPAEYSATQLIWGATGDGWTRTVLSNEEVLHKFPTEHTDFLQQFIHYRVPVEMFSALAAYDGI